MALRVIIVGPGRVGSAFGRQLAHVGVEVLGFVGRKPQAVAAAVKFAGAGAELAASDHGLAHTVLFAVGDAELEDAIAELRAAAPARQCSLWLHTSGCHGLEVFDAVAAEGARRGAIHPVTPFADAESGYRRMVGQPAVIIGDDNCARLLRQIVRRLGMVGVPAAGKKRELYHASCALAANGLVALRGLVDELLTASGELAPSDARRIADALMHNALASAGEHGAGAALSGPVVRGDTTTVSAHLRALGNAVPTAVPAYRALMQIALRLAQARGLPAASAAALRGVLGEEGAES